MRLNRFLAAAAPVFISVLPACADQILGPGRITSANKVVLPGGPTLGTYQSGKFTSQPDAIQIQGPGSTGDVSGMSVTAPGVPAGQFLSSWMTAPIFNGRTIIDPMGLRQGSRGDPGTRGPFFLWNNPTNANPAGQNAGFQVWVGDNPTATPGAGDTAGGTIVVNNGNGRNSLFGANIFTQVCSTSVCGAGYNDAKTAGLEIEAGTGYPSTPTDPWGGGFRKNALELTAQAGSAGRITSAIETWANDATGVGWWQTGIGLSRVADVGILAQANPNGTTGSGAAGPDQINAFATAVLYDNSNSGSTIKVGNGTHSSILDLTAASSFGYFAKGINTAATLANFGNAADYNMAIGIDSGASAAKNSDLYFSDRGSAKWIAGKDASQQWRLYNVATGNVSVSVSPSDVVLTYGDLNIGGGSNVLGLNRAATVNAASGSTGLIFEAAGAAKAYIATDGSSYAQFVTAGSIPILLAPGGAAVLTAGTAAVTLAKPAILPSSTVAGLPTCNAGLKGGMAYVTDATAPTYNSALTGGGSVGVPVACNGTSWTAH